MRKNKGFTEKILEIIRVVFTVAIVLLILYFVLICPRIFGRPKSRALGTKLFAHRGLFDSRAGVPENSMPAFRRAVDAGYGIELDVQMTKDRVPVVFHDFTLKRMCGVPGRVRDFTFEELQKLSLGESGEKIPKFSDVLALTDGKVPLIVEFKSNDTDMSLCAPIDAMLTKYRGDYCIESFNPLVLHWYRRHHNDVCRGQLSDGFLHDPEIHGVFYRTWFLFALQFLLTNILAKPDFIAYNQKYSGNISRRLCRNLFRIRSAAWTIRSEEQLTRARKSFDVCIFDSFIPAESDRC